MRTVFVLQIIGAWCGLSITISECVTITGSFGDAVDYHRYVACPKTLDVLCLLHPRKFDLDEIMIHIINEVKVRIVWVQDLTRCIMSYTS
jgi:hypothetical protein